MLNNISLTGRLVADPELRSTQSGISVCSFRIAVERNTAKRETDFINISAWRQTAEFISKFFAKGDFIALRGELHQKEFEGKDGQKRTTYEVVADQASFCGGAKTNEPAPARQKNDFADVQADDDLPF